MSVILEYVGIMQNVKHMDIVPYVLVHQEQLAILPSSAQQWLLIPLLLHILLLLVNNQFSQILLSVLSQVHLPLGSHLWQKIQSVLHQHHYQSDLLHNLLSLPFLLLVKTMMIVTLGTHVSTCFVMMHVALTSVEKMLTVRQLTIVQFVSVHQEPEEILRLAV